MSVTHDFECLAHGQFESRTKKPKCPKGCSASLVKMVFLQPVGFVSDRSRRSDKLVREMAQTQGLSDLSTSLSRPGGSVMDRLRKKHGSHLQPSQMPIAVDPQTYLKAMTHQENALSRIGLGHAYDPSEWKPNEEGKLRHETAKVIADFKPSAEVEYVPRKAKKR